MRRSSPRAVTLAVAATLLVGAGAGAQEAAVRPTLMTEPWKAAWIAHPDAPGDEFGVFHFRRTLDLERRPERFLVHVSADNRYRLFVNGVSVSAGPARGDLMHWRFETVDLAPLLRPGRNVVAALVWNWGPRRPVAQISARTAFLLEGDGPAEAAVGSGPEWRVFHDRAYAPIEVRGADVDGYYAAPPGEAMDGRLYPWGWEQPAFDDSAWPQARIVSYRPETTTQALPSGSHPYGEAGGWVLVPRNIPQLEETPQRIPSVARAEGAAGGDAFLRGEGDLRVPANSRAVVLLDAVNLTNAYPVLVASGGSGARIRLTYAEAMRDAEGRKGNRNEIAGKTIKGFHDVLTLDGGARRRFQPLWFRTFRFLQLDIETAGEPLAIHDLHAIFTAYPFEERGEFRSPVGWLDDMWEINWRVARLCALDTYVDTPYYEQLQYVGDTRIQSLISLYVSGDDRLMRNAIEQFDDSRIPEGITASRYPSNITQLIPPFSLYWVAMVHDYWMHRDDPAFVRRFIPGMRGVIAWFERHIDETGMLGPMPWWNYSDWSPHYPRGVPPGADDGNSTLITLQLAYTLHRAAELEDRFGQPAEGARYRALAASLSEAARRTSWDARRGLMADSPEKEVFGQQTNSMAILAGAVPEGERRALMERVLADTSLVQASYYYRFYVDEALRTAGLAERYLQRLQPWREMLALGLTTTPETPEPSRSDSHAWSAHPNYGLLATVLGIRPAEAGFRSVLIAPELGELPWAGGRVPHPAGDIEVRLERRGGAGLRAEVVLPPGVPGWLEWNGRRVPLRPGSQTVEF